MDIVLCGNCGFIGDAGELLNSIPPKNEKYAGIIATNGFSCRACPKCKSTSIFYKPKNVTIVSTNFPPFTNFPSALIPPISTGSVSSPAREDIVVHSKIAPKEEVVDTNILDEVLDSVMVPLANDKVEEKIEDKPTKKEKVRPNRTENTKARKKLSCDSCGKSFETRIDGSTRCEPCINSLIKTFG